MIRLFYKTILIVLSICFSIKAAYAGDKERVIWEKKPITVMLSVGQERIIHFPVDIRYWMPESIEKSVTALSANGVLYIEAHEVFEKTRIRVQDLNSQKVYLLDLVSRAESQKLSTELIVTDKAHVKNSAKSEDKKPSNSDWYVRLIRFAAQSLYAPERLAPVDKRIHDVKINSSDIVPLIRGGDIEAIPVNAWQGGGLYVTAIRITNLSDHYIPIKLEKYQADISARSLVLETDVRGQWLAAVSQHTFLKPSGDDEDRTSLYLISKRPFEESL